MGDLAVNALSASEGRLLWKKLDEHYRVFKYIEGQAQWVA